MRALVAGVGSPILGDDGVGIHVVRELSGRELPATIDLCELGTGGLAVADWLCDHDALVVVDAIITGAPPGTVHVLTGDELARGAHLGQGHEPSLPQALALARKLLEKRMPDHVWVVAVEALELTEFSEQLSPAVQAAVPAAADRVLSLLAR